MKEPEEIEDQAYERVVERVCAIDVAKASGKVCTRVPHPSRPGQRRTRVWDVEATTNAILELGEYLAGEEIEKVTLESTSDYWRIWFYLLEAAGLDVQLVNARDIKNAPGRPKTDKLDSVWQAKMTERGMLRPSFVPPVEIRQLRDYTRLRVDLTRERTRYWQRLEKLLEDSLIKVSVVASTLDTKSVRDMLEALIAGERDPKVLADLARGRMKAKQAALIEALTGRFDAHHAELTRMLLDQIDQLTVQIDRLPERRPGRGRRRGRPHRHLPRRTLPAHRQTPRQAQGPRRRRPFHPGHHLAATGRPNRPLSRSRLGLLHEPRQQGPQSPRPHPTARGTRIHRDPHPSRRLRHQRGLRGRLTSIFRLAPRGRPTRGRPTRQNGSHRVLSAS